MPLTIQIIVRKYSLKIFNRNNLFRGPRVVRHPVRFKHRFDRRAIACFLITSISYFYLMNVRFYSFVDLDYTFEFYRPFENVFVLLIVTNNGTILSRVDKCEYVFKSTLLNRLHSEKQTE